MKNKIALLLATWFYSGLIPPIFLGGMAGTYGSFFSIPLCYLALTLVKDWTLYLTLARLIFSFGLMCVPIAERVLGRRIDWRGKPKDHDQNEIVIDEVFGMLLACTPLLFANAEHPLLALLLAFVFFRFFDIVKIPPTRYFDKLNNAFGVMMDDGVAGAYSAIILCLWVLFFGI